MQDDHEYKEDKLAEHNRRIAELAAKWDREADHCLDQWHAGYLRLCAFELRELAEKLKADT